MRTRDGCKVDRVAERRELDDPRYATLDAGLLARWRGDNREAMGYRTLADWFNRRVLREAYDANGRETLGNRVENDYDALTGDDDLLRAEVEESLAADGIDVEALREDIVSWGTLRTHLKECLGGEKPDSAPSDWERDSVARARDVAAEKAAEALSALDTKGEVEGGASATVDVQVQVGCPECPARAPLDVVLRRGYVCERHDRRVEA